MSGVLAENSGQSENWEVCRAALFQTQPPQSHSAFVSSRFLSVVLRAAACVSTPSPAGSQLQNTRLLIQNISTLISGPGVAFLKSE